MFTKLYQYLPKSLSGTISTQQFLENNLNYLEKSGISIDFENKSLINKNTNESFISKGINYKYSSENYTLEKENDRFSLTILSKEKAKAANIFDFDKHAAFLTDYIDLIISLQKIRYKKDFLSLLDSWEGFYNKCNISNHYYINIFTESVNNIKILKTLNSNKEEEILLKIMEDLGKRDNAKFSNLCFVDRYASMVVVDGEMVYFNKMENLEFHIDKHLVKEKEKQPDIRNFITIETQKLNNIFDFIKECYRFKKKYQTNTINPEVVELEVLTNDATDFKHLYESFHKINLFKKEQSLLEGYKNV